MKIYLFSISLGLLMFCLASSLLGKTATTDQSFFSTKDTPPTPILEELDLDTLVNDALQAFNVPGVAVGIVVDGQVVFAKGYGYRNIEHALPVTENTLFAIGSCTKAFTAFMLGQLVDEGKLNWDDPVIAHLPEFRLHDHYTTHHLTIRDLLAHRSGISRHDFLWILHPSLTHGDLIKSLEHFKPVCQLREKFQYNNLMYAVAGIIIERVTGQSWKDALSSRIFTPLSMLTANDSVKTSEQSKDFSLPYMEIEGNLKAIPFRPLQAAAPAGAINASVVDMLKWAQLQLSDGTFLDERLIRKETLQEMHTIQMPMTAANPAEEVYHFGYGLGWVTGIYRGHYYLHHGGGIDGFISQVALLPQEKIGVVLLSNSSSDGHFVVSSVTNTIIDKLVGHPSVGWLEKSKTQRQQVKTAQTQASVKSNQPKQAPRNLEDYVGHYAHPAYGSIYVKQDKDQLLATCGSMTFTITHTCYDIFSGEVNDTCFGENKALTFSFARSTSGDICELSIPLEPLVQAIVFKRQADKELFSTEYLNQFVAVYGEAPLLYTVALKGNKLLLSSGQDGEEFELIPEKHFKFGLKGLPEHSIQFATDAECAVSGLLFTHPLGTLSFNIHR